MDQFEYTLKVQELHKLKTKKAKKEFLEDHAFTWQDRYDDNPNPLRYKLVMEAIQVFNDDIKISKWVIEGANSATGKLLQVETDISNTGPFQFSDFTPQWGNVNRTLDFILLSSEYDYLIKLALARGMLQKEPNNEHEPV